MDNHTGLGRRWTRIIAVLAVLTVISVPVAVFAAGGHFTDDDDSIFESSINWMADSGVTLGCNPPANDHYCPDDNVTRGQMAAFMQRLAENQVVDAATAIEADHAASADDAAMLDGQDPSMYQTVITGATCFGVSCPDAPSTTQTLILEVEINVPADGVLQLSEASAYIGNTATNDYFSTWLTLDGVETEFQGCEGAFFGIPIGDNKVTGSEVIDWVDGNVQYTDTSTQPVVPITAGTHTVRLCGFGSEAFDPYSASLSAVWSAQGTASVPAGSPASVEPSSALVEQLQAAINN